MAVKKGRWITAMGKHIFIEDGQTLKQALEAQGQSGQSAQSGGVPQERAVKKETTVSYRDARNLYLGLGTREENAQQFFNGMYSNSEFAEGSLGKAFDDALTQDEKTAIKDYTEEEGSLNYKAINGYARGKRAKAPPEVQKRIDALDSAISKFELNEPINTFRNVKSSWFKAVFGDINPKDAEGMTITDPAFVSTSVAPRRDSSFGPLSIRITVPAGKGLGAYVANYSDLDYEQEFLLARNTTFRVAKVEMDGKKVARLDLELVKYGEDDR